MRYRIHMGDCLDVLYAMAVEVGDRRPVVMVFADLPYGVTANKWDTPIDLKRLWGLLLAVAKPNAAFIFTATQPFATTLINSQPKLFRYDLVWDKTRTTGFLDANRKPLRRHENILVMYRSPPVYTPQKTRGQAWVKTRARRGDMNYGKVRSNGHLQVSDGQRFPTSILTLPSGNARSLHPTQKPVALLEWLIKTYSNPGDVILDPTMGSGTTGVACANTGRDFIGIEKEPNYFKTAADRIADAMKKGAA